MIFDIATVAVAMLLSLVLYGVSHLFGPEDPERTYRDRI